MEQKFLEHSLLRSEGVRKFRGTKVLGLFAPWERMFHGIKVPRERKFSLWTFRSRERKCRGTKRPDTRTFGTLDVSPPGCLFSGVPKNLTTQTTTIIIII